MMKPRGFVSGTLILWIAGGVAVAALAGWLWWRADHWCNSRCMTERDIAQAAILRVGTLEEAIAAAQQRATDLALMWSEAIQRVEVRYVEREQERVRRFAGVRERVESVGVSGRIRLSDDARLLLGDAARSSGEAGGSAPAPAGDSRPDAPAPAPAGGEIETTAQEWVTWSVAVAEWAAEARAKHSFCVEAYGKIREASNE